jgi:hypothetical protein
MIHADVQLLRDPAIFPTQEVLETALGKDVFAVYAHLYDMTTGPGIELNPEWNYYKDGKAWLYKVGNGKKTVFWLSVWEKHIKVSFYFTEKTRMGIFELPISEEIKRDFNESRPIGKLIPLSLSIETPGQLEDLKEVIQYKKGLK